MLVIVLGGEDTFQAFRHKATTEKKGVRHGYGRKDACVGWLPC